jgi:hypothetical protein
LDHTGYRKLLTFLANDFQFHLCQPRPSESQVSRYTMRDAMIRPGVVGPRSLMRATMCLLFFRLLILMRVPKGSLLCAAVKALGLQRSPLAVRRRLRRRL